MEFSSLAGKIKVFEGLDSEQIGIINQYVCEIPLSRGTWVVREGEQGDGMYIIAKGKVQVWKNDSQNSQGVCIGELGQGDCFGEMSLIDRQPRSANVIAMSDLTVFKIPHHAMMELYEKNASLFGLFLMNLAKEISYRLRESEKSLVEFSLPIRT